MKTKLLRQKRERYVIVEDYGVYFLLDKVIKKQICSGDFSDCVKTMICRGMPIHLYAQYMDRLRCREGKKKYNQLIKLKKL